jgi:hypothetical protein
MTETVKAREHYEASSLDLTTPSDVVDELELSQGDVFRIIVNNNDTGSDNLTISYGLVHSSNEE